MAELKFKETEVVERKAHTTSRYPNLNTVLMVEKFLQSHKEVPLKISDIKRQLPKQVMHQTLLLILEYLWKSGKIIYGPRGVQWIYSEPEHLARMLNDSMEI